MKKQKILWPTSCIADEAEKMFPGECKTIRNVKMLYTKEIGEFIRKMQEAHEKAGDSKLIFK